MNDTPSLSVAGLRKEFGSITALDGVDLTVDGPEILGLAGPNGSGKTTLIRCLLGLEDATAGETRIGDTTTPEFAREDRARIGYMPQSTAVYDDLTVRENVAFFARLYGVGGDDDVDGNDGGGDVGGGHDWGGDGRDNDGGGDDGGGIDRAAGQAAASRGGSAGSHAPPDDRAAAVDRALDLVDLTGRSDARIDELSGGMVRRTSLACAVVHDPDVLVLDEPTVGLDPRLRASMWSRFRDRRDDGTLVLVSTHYLGEAGNCDRVCFLRDGRVLALDSPEGFLDRTGTADMEEAFLALLDESDAGTDRDERSAGEREERGAPGPDPSATVASGGDTR